MADTIFWRDLEARFRTLHDEQLQNPTKAGLHAHWPGDGRPWDLSGGPVDIRKKFEYLAEAAARELKHAGGPAAVFFWLDRLKAEDTYFKPIDSMWAEKQSIKNPTRWKSGIIELVCKASADFCLKCAATHPSQTPAGRKAKKDYRKGFDGLTEKYVDMSGYLAHVDLTQRQRECFSLRKEYNLPLTEVAARLGIDRKTADEHIHQAEKKIRIQVEKRRDRSGRIRIAPDED